MPVVSVDIKNRQPYADGTLFGATGDYERIDGVLGLRSIRTTLPTHPSLTWNTLPWMGTDASASNLTSPWWLPASLPAATVA